MTVKERIKLRWDEREKEYLAQGQHKDWTNPPLKYMEDLVYKHYYLRLQHWLGEPVLSFEEFLNQEITVSLQKLNKMFTYIFTVKKVKIYDK